MIDRKYFLYLVAMIVMIPATKVIADDAKICKCPVTGEKVVVADAEASSVYKKATVYLCCNDCKKKFDPDRKKFSTKANLQLVVTGQAKQVKCPIAGRPMNADQTVVAEGVKVSLCCGNCKGKAAAAKGDEQLAMLFGDKAFAKGFEIIKKSE